MKTSHTESASKHGAKTSNADVKEDIKLNGNSTTKRTRRNNGRDTMITPPPSNQDEHSPKSTPTSGRYVFLKILFQC